jgi:hypothetical protein
MSLQIGDALGNGIQRGLTYTGGVLMALTIAYQLVFLASVNTIFREALPPEVQQTEQFAFALPIPAAAAGVLAVLGMLFGMVLYIAATRALTRDVDSLSSLPRAVFTRRMGRAALSAIGANIVVSIAVFIGFILLVVPGIFLAVSFSLVIFAIGVEDERAIASLRRSWALASGSRWRLFALILVIAVGTSALSGVGTLLSAVNPIAGQVASIVITGVLSVLAYGILADAYLQLRSEDASDATAETTSVSA